MPRALRIWSLAAVALALAGDSWTAAAPGGNNEPSRIDRFAVPPANARIIKIIHSWPDDPKAQDQLRARSRAQGFGGVVCNVSFDQYLESEEKWQAFVRATSEARREGMAMWLYDERGYPSGNAGGLVLRDHPEWEARGLLVGNQECPGGAVELNVPPGRLLLAAAFPMSGGGTDLSGKVDLAPSIQQGQVRWQAPEGRWQVMAITEDRLYDGTHADGNLYMKMPYINLLMPEPTARFLQLTHQRYAEHLGADLGRTFMGTFTDEPSLMSCFLRPMPYQPLPWAPNLPLQFEKRRGYSLSTNAIPALVAEAGPAGKKVRYSFWQTVGELVSENYFGQIQSWCRQHNVPSGGHLLMEEGLVAHVPLYGDFFRCARRLDAPSIDCLTSVPGEVPWFIARLLASAAELEGRELVMSETSDHSQVWRPAGDKRPKRIVSEAEIRGTCNRLLVSGVNNITSYYSFTGLSDEQLQRLNHWVGRCCTLLRGGYQAADIAVVYPVESIWTKFIPARHWANESPAASRVENIYRAAIDSLFAGQRDFTFIDSRTLSAASTDQGVLSYKQLRWRVVVLPGVDTLPLAAWENLARFVDRGGVVVALGDLPANSESAFPDGRVEQLGKELFGSGRDEPRATANAKGGAGIFLPAGSEGVLPFVLNGVVEPDVKVTPARAPVRVTHRRHAGEELYFLINDSAKPWEGSVEFASTGLAECLNPATGQRVSIDGTKPLRLQLDGFGGRLVQFSEARLPGRRSAKSGGLPNLVSRALPPTVPALAHGEFVSGQLTADEAPGSNGSPIWKASALLRKGQVDTFLFARLLYPQTLDLAQVDCLALETWVPDGQKAPAQLLVILHEKGGGDFLATTGRSLAAPGRNLTYLPLTRFQLAGWSQDADGELDLAHIDEVRVGWGGYLGSEGESVDFSFALPKAGTIRTVASKDP